MVMNQENIQKVTDRMRRLCSRREYCSSDIHKKVSDALDGDRDAASKVLDVLVADKYVDDLRYATAYARDKATISGWGVTKIRYMLSGKGIEREVISKALEEIDEGKAEVRLGKLLENKWRTLKDDPHAKLKLLRFALGRGYGYEESKSAVEKVISLNE